MERARSQIPDVEHGVGDNTVISEGKYKEAVAAKVMDLKGRLMDQHKDNQRSSKTEPKTLHRKSVHEYDRVKEPCNEEAVKSLAQRNT